MSQIEITADRKISIIAHLNNYAASLEAQIEGGKEESTKLGATGYRLDVIVSLQSHIARLETLLAEVTENAQFLLEQ